MTEPPAIRRTFGSEIGKLMHEHAVSNPLLRQLGGLYYRAAAELWQVAAQRKRLAGQRGDAYCEAILVMADNLERQAVRDMRAAIDNKQEG